MFSFFIFIIQYVLTKKFKNDFYIKDLSFMDDVTYCDVHDDKFVRIDF